MCVVLDMDLKFEKYCKIDQSPTTVLPSPRYAKHESRISKGRLSSRNDDVSLETGFREIKLRNYHRSVSCKTLPVRNNKLSVDSEVHRRGSVYQSSLKGLESDGGRKKIEVSLSGDDSFSFSLLDSICGSDEDYLDKCSVESSRESCSGKLDIREGSSFSSAELDLMENSEFKGCQVASPTSNANILKEKDNRALRSPLLAKLAFSNSPVHLDSFGSKGSPKSRFTPFRRMFEPLTKSKSHRSPLSSKLETGDLRTSESNTDCVPHCVPGHLHGDLRLEHKHGVPYFELSLTHSEDIFVAKTWKAEDKLNWVYTFHSVQGTKKSNASGSGMKYSNKDSPKVGQMQVSCHLLSEIKDGKVLSDSIVTEFVLYDIMHSQVSDVNEVLNGSNEGLTRKSSTDYSSPYPLATSDLNPSLETAVVVIQVPFKKRESLKYSSGDKFSHQTPNGVTDNMFTRVHVLTPMGNHSLPTCESKGPSPLLDRWRLGGGCDCGGWDMACPVVVFSNPSTELQEEHSFLHDRPLELYTQGAKEKTPTLTIQFSGKGHYAVDFHAQLSALQAFSVCVAMLHATEVSNKSDQEKHTQRRAPKAFVEDEVKILIEPVTEEQKKEKVRRRVDNHPSSFMLNPPFSPISRV